MEIVVHNISLREWCRDVCDLAMNDRFACNLQMKRGGDWKGRVLRHMGNADQFYVEEGEGQS